MFKVLFIKLIKYKWSNHVFHSRQFQDTKRCKSHEEESPENHAPPAPETPWAVPTLLGRLSGERRVPREPPQPHCYRDTVGGASTARQSVQGAASDGWCMIIRHGNRVSSPAIRLYILFTKQTQNIFFFHKLSQYMYIYIFPNISCVNETNVWTWWKPSYSSLTK